MLRGYRAFSRLLDDAVFATCVVFGPKRAFSETPPGEPPAFDELLDELRRRPPRIRWPARLDGPARVGVELPHLGLESWFDFAPSRRVAADTLIVYHHGLGEIPHDTVPRCLSLGPRLGRCDWAIAKAVHHEGFAQVSTHFTADRDALMRYILASAATVRHIARHLRGRYRHLVLCGVSMGGLVTLVEACHEPYYDLHVPLVSGPDLGDVMTNSIFALLVEGAFLRQARRTRWLDGLDLVAQLQDSPGPPLRPLLARSDRIFRLGPQRAAYARIPRARVSVFEGGHISGAANLLRMGRHLAGAIEEICWFPAGRPREPKIRRPPPRLPV